jgi:hypothetical protein
MLKSGYDRDLVPVETPVLVEQGKGVHQLLRSKEKVKNKYKKKRREKDQNRLTMV